MSQLAVRTYITWQTFDLKTCIIQKSSLVLEIFFSCYTNLVWITDKKLFLI